MASRVVDALNQALLTGSSPNGYYWAFVHPNPDAPPQTYRLTRKSRNGWTLLLAASKATKEVVWVYMETEEDQKAVTEALKWLGISATISTTEAGTFLNLASGETIVSKLYGPEEKAK
jgi:dipeptidyl aminopeptidase/acylaminoacyl peptidase